VTPPRANHWAARLPFYYGWIIVGVAFVTMAIGVSARTSFSLLMPPLIDEFKWDRVVAAGAFSFGFLVSAVSGPIIGRIIDLRGPRIVILGGVGLLAAGSFLAPLIERSWHLYITLGVLVGSGANLMTYTVHSQFLPNWFVRRRGLAISLAFSGVGVGAIVLLPWLQSIIVADGWRTACWTMGIIMLRPQDSGLLPDGDKQLAAGGIKRPSNIVDPAWAAIEWTLARALRTARFWWVMIAYFLAIMAWYAVQVHQTKYLVEIGFTPAEAAWALGIVAASAIPGQIFLGGLSDRIGREWVWTIGCFGFGVCYAALIAMEHSPSHALLYTMVVSQGFLGYSLTSVMGPVVAEIFEGPHFGTIFGVVGIALLGGGAAGPWMTGVIYDATGSYRLAFAIIIGLLAISAITIWLASPRKVRAVAGRMRRIHGGAA
jgi:MFS family permease